MCGGPSLGEEGHHYRYPHESHLGFYSRYFLISKKSGENRPILDLRVFNRSSTRPHPVGTLPLSQKRDRTVHHAPVRADGSRPSRGSPGSALYALFGRISASARF